MSTIQEDILPSKLSDTDNSISKELLALIAQNSSSNKNKEQALDKHLKLSPPAITQNSVEYNQVFRMVPNKNFYSLYNRCYRAHNPSQALPENDLVYRSAYYKRIQIIDRRPKRWYQTLAKLSSQIDEITYTKGLLEINLTYLKKSMSDFKVEDKFGNKQADYHALNNQYKKNLNKLLELKNILMKYDYLVNQVIDEISSAGYLYYKDKEVTIRKSIPEQAVQSPLKPENIQTVNEEKWKALLQELKNKLFLGDNKHITTPEKKQKFDTNSAELCSTQSCPIIQDFLIKTQNEINSYQQELDTLNQINPENDPIVVRAKSDCETQITTCDQEIKRCNDLIQRAEQPLIDANRGRPINEDDPSIKNVINRFLIYIYKGTEDFDTLKAIIKQKNQDKDTAIKNKNTIIDDFSISLKNKLKTAESKRSDAQARKDAYDANQVLKEERIKFLLFWNDTENYDNQKTTEKDIDPEKDPLQHFYHHISKTKASNSKPYHIHRFTYQGDGYYDEKLLSLVEFMELPDLVNRIAIFPYIDDNGQPLSEVFRIIIGPQKPGITAEPEMPVVKMVETHELNVSWQRYALGELKSAINLAPGEKKQIVVEKQTKITRQVNESRTDSSNQQRNITSSFEDNLTNELSNSYNLSKSDENSKAYKQDQSNSNNSSLQNENSRNKSNSEKAEAHGSFFDNMFSASAEISVSSANSKKSTQAQSAQTALAISQSENGQTLTKSGRESNTKNIHNRVKKVATETSSNNKVEVTSSSSEQYEESTSNKEIMTLANPNEGRAINYNLYQLQNIYESCINLNDMKIVVNTGIELAEGSGILDTRVYELEDFNKIFRNTTKSPSEILMCAFIAHKILNNYTDLKNQDNIDNGILKIKLKSGQNMALVCAELKQIIKDLNLYLVSKNTTPPNKDVPPESSDTNLKIKLTELQKALLALQKFTFVFRPHHLLSKSQQVVNAPAYHMDTQIGKLAATEPYLENQRELALKTKEANVDLIHAEADYWRNLKSLKDSTNASSLAPSAVIFPPLRGSPVDPNKTRMDQSVQLPKAADDDIQRTELKH